MDKLAPQGRHGSTPRNRVPHCAAGEKSKSAFPQTYGVNLLPVTALRSWRWIDTFTVRDPHEILERSNKTSRSATVPAAGRRTLAARQPRIAPGTSPQAAATPP